MPLFNTAAMPITIGTKTSAAVPGLDTSYSEYVPRYTCIHTVDLLATIIAIEEDRVFSEITITNSNSNGKVIQDEVLASPERVPMHMERV